MRVNAIEKVRLFKNGQKQNCSSPQRRQCQNVKTFHKKREKWVVIT